ncbi:hypothetical protein Tco_0769720 [Tanacetum coccineum]|uniref:Mitochondrial inner membrane translocase subunit Tim17/Tim22/Tim23/peroxisomal protein PMP24 n=1 Tax=Tanacetum coccineum TaxID=301880 RepID=A0ABQ4ZA68_9ASTR
MPVKYSNGRQEKDLEGRKQSIKCDGAKTSILFKKYLGGGVIGAYEGVIKGVKAFEAGMERGIVLVRDVDDVFNSVVAGFGTRALFKVVSGVRSTGVAAAIGGNAAGIAIARTYF